MTGSTAPPSGGAALRQGARLMWRYARTHPGPLAVSITGTTLFAFMSIGTAVVLGRVTDEVVVPGLSAASEGVDDGTLTVAAAVIVGVAVLKSIGVVARRYFAAMTSRRLQVTWRERLSDNFVRLPLRRLSARPTGELLAATDNDVTVSTMAINPLPFSVGVVVLVIVAVVSLAALDVWLLGIGLVLFPLIAWMSHVYSTRVVGPVADIQAGVADVSAIVHESVDGALVVKTLGREAAEQARLAAAAERLRSDRVRFGSLRAVYEPVLEALPNLGALAVVAVGAWRVSEGAVTTGDVVQALAIFQVLAFPMRVLGFFLEELPLSVVAAGRLDRLLADRPPPPLTDASGLPAGPLAVEIAGVALAHGDHVVFDGLDLRIEPGEVVALVGSTGSGKSQLASLLAGLQRPDRGTVAVGGVDVADVDADELAAAVALVFQETYLFADSVRENVTLGADVADIELRSALAVAQADRFVAAMPEGLDTVVGERGVTLSGGQRQRVALTRALVRRPRLLVLDDATSAVDPVVEQAILDGLRHQLATTTVVVAHRLSTIALADRVVYLADGRVAATGGHDELLADVPGYRTLVRAYETAETAVVA